MATHQDMTSRTSFKYVVPDPTPEKPVSPAKACINRANANSAAQNRVLKKIEGQQHQMQQTTNKVASQMDNLQRLVAEINSKVAKIEAELYRIVQQSSDMAATAQIIRTKEKEREFLQHQLNSIQYEVKALSRRNREYEYSRQHLYTPNRQVQPLFPPSVKSQPKYLDPFSLVEKYEKQWKPVIPPPAVPPSQPFVPALTHQELIPTPVSKGKAPIVPIPEYIPEITGGASVWLPSEILPVEEPNPISSFLRATALKDHEEDISSDSGNSDGQIFMADPGPSVQHPDEASTMD
ncbi:hypothetical protein ACLOJK_015876 [Asimina triloba]